MHEDPVGSWWHLAERMPVSSVDPFESQAVLLYLVAVAGDAGDDLDATVAHILGSIGWMLSDGTPPTASQASGSTSDSRAVLRRIGATASESPFGPQVPTADGVLFARAALRSWPK